MKVKELIEMLQARHVNPDDDVHIFSVESRHFKLVTRMSGGGGCVDLYSDDIS